MRALGCSRYLNIVSLPIVQQEDLKLRLFYSNDIQSVNIKQKWLLAYGFIGSHFTNLPLYRWCINRNIYVNFFLFEIKVSAILGNRVMYWAYMAIISADWCLSRRILVLLEREIFIIMSTNLGLFLIFSL